MLYRNPLGLPSDIVICQCCRSQKFEDPAEGEAVLVEKFSKLHEDLTAGFRALEDETR